ncbi:MAG TPA: ABC transporter permease, partial [Candidatus Angelobacter sp.]
DYVKAGMDPEQARRHARIEFGGIEGVKEVCRQSRKVHMVETSIQDLRYGLRMLRRSPGFTAVAVLTLMLGIGANTAIFSVVNGILLNPFPYPHAEQIITLHESKPNFATGSVSYPNFRDWRTGNRSFSAMAITRSSAFSLTGMGDAEQVNGEFVSSDFFPLFGVTPVVGRTFAGGEDEIGRAPLALIGAGLWQRKFGGARDILGKSITLDARDYTIIGVIPADFKLNTWTFRAADVYLPIGQWNNPLLSKRIAGLGIHGFARLKPGITMQQAQTDMDRVAANLAAAYPGEDKGIGASLVPLRNWVVGPLHPFLIVLLAAVGFVLMIACANVANLLLARATGRTREFAVRIALGASKIRIVRQLLIESVLLGILGGVLALVLAGWGLHAMLKILPQELPRAEEIRLDGHVLTFTMFISVISGILFGLAPALKVSASNLVAQIKEGGRNLSRRRHTTQNTFVVVEMALALVLLAGAGLMTRSLIRLWNVDPGFDSHNLLTFSVSLPPSMMKASPDAMRAAFRQLDEKIAAVPGVESMSVSWAAVPLLWDDEQFFWMEGQPKPQNDNDMNWTLRYVVEPDYLKVMGTQLLRGRFLNAHDDEHAAPVVVIDDVFASQYFPNQNPIGRHINRKGGNDEIRLAEIVGVVKHVKQWGLDSDDKQSLRAQAYEPFMQLPDDAMKLSASGTGIIVRSKGPVTGLFESIRGALHQMNSEQVVFGPATMDEIVAQSLATRRYSMLLLGIFAGLALLLASVGIYGVISYVVGERTHEIGIRMALGARRSQVLGMVLGQGLRLILVGIVAGLAAALALTRLMASLLFGVSAADPLTFSFGAAMLLLVALLACVVPAQRAMQVDPTVALRYE